MSAHLPGRGWSALHDNLEATVQDMMKLGGIYSQRQATNFLLGKVGDPYITRHVNALAGTTRSDHAKFAIIPDLHAINFPWGNNKLMTVEQP